MTEQEAFEWKCYRAIDLIKRIKTEETPERYVDRHKAFDTAISALEEIQQYRALGTVEEIKKKIRKELPYMSIAQAKFKSELNAYRAIGTVEEVREAMEKQTPKKPKAILRHRGGFEMEHCPNCDTDYQVDRRYAINDDYCSTCGKLLDSSFRNFCANCGQATDRSDENETD